MIHHVIIPSLGATGGDIVLIEWLTNPGERIQKGQPLFVVQTDKADMEVEAFRDGYFRRAVIPAGSTVSPGQMVAVLSDSVDEPLATEVNSASAIVSPSTHDYRTIDYRPLDSLDGLLQAYRRMVLIRRFEDHLYDLFLQGLVPGTLHQCQGQEAVAVGVCSALERDDAIFSTHRPVGHFIAKGCPLASIAAELWGKATGCAGGKGGQMHLTDMNIAAFPSNAIVGANIPIATGAALGFRLAQTSRVAVSFFGDGATNIGAFHEGINLAAVKNAPVIFVCENNQYAASTHISLTTRVCKLAERAKAYGIPGHTVDGMDLMAVHQLVREAVARARAGEGPTFLECLTYRYAGHSRGDPGGYRTKEELHRWREQDPIPRCREVIKRQYGVEEGEFEKIARECQQSVEAAIDFARSSSDPLPDELEAAVYASVITI
jgi:TPP-dependent pyruvate/acetoin dehydrogenase alpha subunit